ncbi:cytochrome c oxidase subunit i [Lucifera butyrica]|uniref:Cytochrome c oxidase subunit i n=1 Tax=Lucifera butyrica TaxID=1351585 RepID=A0A498RI12_9FIRM|nr:cbb3-type cytochrome c oxidase subunit I [Lucifera butyrica]VBB09732.1 cytochrome c oxidase subunit i [Lucifera butyrica]
MFQAQRLSGKYALVACLLFWMQGFAATVGALELAFPELVFPISYAAGRAFHLNISIYWPLIGVIGAVYFFFSLEAEQEIYSPKLVDINFWLLTGSTFLILGSLLFGFTEGREYLEAIWPLKLATAASTLLLGYNLLRTYLASKAPKSRATLVSMVAGSITLILFYVPNIMSYAQPTVDEIAKFWVVHLWEEMSLELMGTGVLAALLIQVTGAQRQATETAIYLDMTFVALAGILATGHHYYWVGVPAFWLWVGGICSALQILPAILLVYAALQTATFSGFANLEQRDQITLALVGSSLFYHIFGASFLGFFMAYPGINRYIHGTYITSAHSHLALFGVFGFLALAVCFYIIFTEFTLTSAGYRWCWAAVIALNLGLLIMGTGLLLAGGLQAYFWRVIGLSIGATNQLIQPYLFLRMLGGMVYVTGSTLLFFIIAKSVWAGTKAYTDKAHCNNNSSSVHELLKCLVQKEKRKKQLLYKISDILRQLLWLGKKRGR